MMEKKRNTGLFVVIGILIILVLILLVLFGVLIWKGMGQRGAQSGNSHASNSQISETQSSDDGAVADAKDARTQDSETNTTTEDLHFVQDGYEFTVPGMYDLTHTEETGVVVYDEDRFQMKIRVTEGSYEEVMSNPEEFTKAIVDAEGTIEQDMKETGMDGKKYAYYRANLQDQAMLVIYTAAPEEGKRIAGQIALLEENVVDEGMLQMFSFIASSAVATDQADSTKDDIVVEMAEKKPSSIAKEWVGESAMEFGGIKATHKIPENFYLEDRYEGSEYAAERYMMEEPYISVTCSLYDIPWYANVESYIDQNKHLDNTKMKTMDIDGHKVYYVVESFMSDEDEYQQIYAGCDLGEHQFYVVEAYMIGEDMELTMDTIREFLIVE